MSLKGQKNVLHGRRELSIDDNSDENNPYTITEETLRNRQEQRSNGKFCPQLYAAIIAGLGAFSFGSALGWSSPALPNIIGEEKYARYLTAWIISLVPLGSAIGISVWTYFNNKLGPRKSMLVQAPFTLLIWVLLATKHHINLYMVARFFCGLFSVSYIISGETLLMECIHRANVPCMIIGHRACIMGGVLFSYSFGGYLQHYRADFKMSISNPFFIMMHSIMLWFCPESPVFLYNKNEAKAIKALIWYKGEDNLVEELRLIKKDAEIKKADPDADKYMFYSRVVVKAMLIVLGLFFCQVFTGYYAFMFEYSKIWEDFGGSCISPLADSCIYGACLLIFNSIGSIIHYRGSFGVRKPLILSCIILFTTNALSAAYSMMYSYDFQIIVIMSKFFPLISTCIYVLGYETGVSAYPDILLADYMPTQIFFRARMICKTFSWFMVFLYVHLYTFFRKEFGMNYVFTSMSVTSFLTLLMVCLFVVETKNKTLIKIQLELGGNPIGNRGGIRQRSYGVDRKLLTAAV